MKKEVKIILNSGISITISEKDKVVLDIEHEDEQYSVTEIDRIENIPAMIMNAKNDIIIHHSINTGEYMEYYLTRDKITWCYYSETKEGE